MNVTAEMFPKVYQAFTIINADNGVGKIHQHFVPNWRISDVRCAELALATLSAIEMNDFCVGEFEAQLRLARQSRALLKTHSLLNDFFEGWIPNEKK